MSPTNNGRQIGATSLRTRVGSAAPKSSTNKRSRIKVTVWSGILIVMLVGGVTLGTVAKQVFSVRSQLMQSADLVEQLRSQLEDGDNLSAQQTLAALEGQTSSARSTVTGPLWKLSSLIPIAGPNFIAVREVAVSANDLVSKAVGPLLQEYDSFEWAALSPINGKIDVTSVQKAAPSLTLAANTVELSHARLASIDLDQVLPKVADPVKSAVEQLDGFSATLRTAASTSNLLPALLGAEQPHKFLVLVQNSAEQRATGGIPGALAVLRTDNGKIELAEQGSASALGTFKPALDVSQEQELLYTQRLGTHMQNVNLTPDFPTAAMTAKRMWEERHYGQTIDGVLALDPVVLSHLLEATGPVSLIDPDVLNLVRGTSLPTALTSDNVVRTLLSDVYREIEDPQAQDAYFSSVAAQIFTAFADGQGKTAELIQALARSSEENRLYLWSSHSSEQDIIASTPMHGAVTGSEAGGAAFGAYFNDGTGAKMDFYVTRTVNLIQGCPVDGYGRYTVRITAANNAPGNAGTILPAYVTGGNVFGVQPGNIRTNYVVYGPAQAFVEAATVDGKSVPVSSGKHGSRPVGTVSLELGPGEKSTIDMIFSGVVQDAEPQLRVTPGVQPPQDVMGPLKHSTCG